MSEPTLAPVEEDLTYYENRYPNLFEILKDGGITGVEYCWISGGRVKQYTEWEDETGMGRRWSQIRDIPPITIAGPAGTVSTVLLMGRGEPIRGTHDFNGVRKAFVDKELEEEVGIPACKDSPVQALWDAAQEDKIKKSRSENASTTGKKP